MADSIVPINPGSIAHYLYGYDHDLELYHETIGKAARFLEIDKLSKSQFERVLRNLHPTKDEPLFRSHVRQAPGFHGVLTGHPSYTMPFYITDDPVIHAHALRIMKESARVALEHHEREFAKARTGPQGINREPAGLFGIMCMHLGNNKKELLPHTHYALLPKGLCDDGQWRSLDGPEFLRGPSSTDAVFHNGLAHGYEKTFGWESERRGYTSRLKGVPDSVIEKLFTRGQEARDWLKAHGWNITPAAMDVAIRATRTAKDFLTDNQLIKNAYETGRELGVASQVKLHQVSRAYCEKRDQDRANYHVHLSINEIKQVKPVFSSADLLAYASARSMEKPASQEAFRRVIADVIADPKSRGLNEVSDGIGGHLFVDRNYDKATDRYHRDLGTLRDRERHALPQGRVMSAMQFRTTLDANSKDKVATLAQMKTSMLVVEGSFRDAARIVRPLADLYERNGYQVWVAGSCEKSARILGAKGAAITLGAGDMADSLHRGHMSNIARGLLYGRGNLHQRIALAEKLHDRAIKFNSKDVVVIDGKASIEDKAQLLAAAKAGGAKVIIAGESQKAVEKEIERVREKDKGKEKERHQHERSK